MTRKIVLWRSNWELNAEIVDQLRETVEHVQWDGLLPPSSPVLKEYFDDGEDTDTTVTWFPKR